MKSEEYPPAFVPPQRLEAVAQEFLKNYNPSGNLPVPIEEIVEFDLGMNIVPLPNLQKDFDIEGFLSLGRREISVDQGQLEGYETRFRFTLAHEVGHMLLHRRLYEGLAIRSLEQWIGFRETVDPELISDYEWQADNLAGRILVPEAPLIVIARRHLQKVPPDLLERVTQREVLRSLSLPLADEFQVSPGVVEIRLFGDRVGDKMR
jgi:hypothetical protein